MFQGTAEPSERIGQNHGTNLHPEWRDHNGSARRSGDEVCHQTVHSCTIANTQPMSPACGIDRPSEGHHPATML